MANQSFSDGTSASGIITLTSDFGLADPFVGVMKGRILACYRDATIVDLTHGIAPYWPAEAGFWLTRSYRYFTPGTVHVAVVDPGVGTQRAIVCVEADGQLFLAPDNGLLAPLVVRASGARMWRLDLARLAHLGVSAPTATFHGRDIFAPVAAELAAGRRQPADVGEQIGELARAQVSEPTLCGKCVTGVVITVDHFGNLITNIDGSLLLAFQRPVVRLGGHEFALLRTYGDRKPGEYLALINSFDVVEIARAEQSAAAGLALGRGAPVVVVEG
jgi:S-adenosylmethionine hydrolase